VARLSLDLQARLISARCNDHGRMPLTDAKGVIHTRTTASAEAAYVEGPCTMGA
jgi:hypothetical protein